MLELEEGFDLPISKASIIIIIIMIMIMRMRMRIIIISRTYLELALV
jgi:hypothetical protein